MDGWPVECRHAADGARPVSHRQSPLEAQQRYPSMQLCSPRNGQNCHAVRVRVCVYVRVR